MAAINSVYTQKRATTALLPLLYESLEPLRSKLPLVGRRRTTSMPRHRSDELGRRCHLHPVEGQADVRLVSQGAPQAEFENCVAHNGSLIPIPGRDILVQSW